MNILSNEIIFNILLFLEPKDIINFNLTSKRYLIFLKDIPLWERLALEMVVIIQTNLYQY
jgi:F-box domain